MLAQPTYVINSLGYLGIFVTVFLLPIPQELVLPLAGFMAAQGKLSLRYIVIAGVMGSTLGSLPWYCVGRFVVGERRFQAWTKWFGQWLKLSARDIHKAKKWFKKHGTKAVLFSQAVPGMRTLIAVPAGISKMNLLLFLLYLTISGVVWQGLLAYGGYLLGNHYGLIDQYLSPSSRVLVLVVLVVFIIWLLRRKK